MTARFSWKRNPPETGLRAVVAWVRGYKLHRGGVLYATVQPFDARGTRWYYVVGWDSGIPYRNTADDPVDTPDEAKRRAMEYVRRHTDAEKES